MSAIELVAEPIERDAFAPFGDVVDASGDPSYLINNDACGRFHDRGRLTVDDAGRLGLSLFDSRCFTLPLPLSLVERHPLASQTFIPMSAEPYLVVVAPDENGTPGMPRAFVAGAGQAINLLAGTWHGVLTPLGPPGGTNGLFAVVDRVDAVKGKSSDNCETYTYSTPFTIKAAQ